MVRITVGVGVRSAEGGPSEQGAQSLSACRVPASCLCFMYRARPRRRAGREGRGSHSRYECEDVRKGGKGVKTQCRPGAMMIISHEE